ncbi:MAG: autotransporter outer membrane beta-barrel domain-containing protein [Desulfocapsaceae bacterium]|nr:autotransporter outer membrane beta-barrel domain-containing protein [Desulfocapsaceae bacterium]
MNRIFKTVWSSTLLTWVAVPEISKARRGGVSGKSCRKPGAAAWSLRKNFGFVFPVAMVLGGCWATAASAVCPTLPGGELNTGPGETCTAAPAGTYTNLNAAAGSTIILSNGAFQFVNTENARNTLLINPGAGLTADSPLSILSSGDNAAGIVLSGAGADISLTAEDNGITTSGAGAHAIQLLNGATKTLDLTSWHLSALKATGAGAAVLAASGSGSVLTLTDSPLTMSMVGSASWGAKAEDGGHVVLAGSASSGGTGLWASGGGSTLLLQGNAEAAGSKIRLEGGGVLDVSGSTLNGGTRIGSLEGAAGSSVLLGNTVLNIGVNNSGNNGSLVNSANFAGVISGTGGLNKTGTTTQILSGLNTYTGKTTITSGTLQTGVANALAQSSDVNIGSSGTFNLNNYSQTVHNLSGSGTINLGNSSGTVLTVNNASGTTSFSGSINGAGGLTKTGAGTLILGGWGYNYSTGKISIDAGTLQAGASNELYYNNEVFVNTGATLALNGSSQTVKNLSGGGAITLGSGVLTADYGSGVTGSFAGTITGTGSLTKAGAGTMTFDHLYGYTGATIIGSGTLKMLGDNLLTNSSDITVNGSLDLNNTSQTVKKLAGSGTVTLGTGTLTADNSGGSTFSGVINGGTTGAMDKTGTGQLELKLATTGTSAVKKMDVHAGTLMMSGGTLSVNQDFTNHDGAASWVGVGNSRLNIGGSYTAQDASTLNLTLANDKDTPVILAQNATLDGILVFNGFADNSASTTYAVTKLSELSGTRYTALETANPLQGAFNETVTTAAHTTDYLWFDWRDEGTKLTLGLDFSWTNAETDGNGAFTKATGSFTVNKGTAFDVDQVLSDRGDVNTGSALSSWDGKSLSKNGPGLLVLSAENDYTGKTTVNEGELRTNHADAFKTSSDVVVNAKGLLNLNDHDQYANRLAGTGKITLGTLKATTLEAHNATVSDNSSFLGTISGAGNLQKTGTGILTLSSSNGYNSYSGKTLVEEGGLKADSNYIFSYSSDVILSTGTTVEMTGTTQRARRLAGDGEVLMGNGTLTVMNDSPDGASPDSVYSGLLSGANGNLNKDGGGMFTLAQAASYTGATAIIAGTMQLDVVDALKTSSQVTVNARLNLQDNDQQISRLTGNTAGLIDMGSAQLTLDNTLGSSSYAGKLTGSGDLLKIGAATLALSGVGSSVGNVDVKAGTISYMQNGIFKVTGDYTTESQATTQIGAAGARLDIDGKLIQESGSKLDIRVGATPDVVANSAQLDGTITVSGFSLAASDIPVKASDLLSNLYTVIRTDTGITGNFVNTPAFTISGPDFLLNEGRLSDDRKEFNLGFHMAWINGDYNTATGDFTLATGTGFNLDIALDDRTIPGGFANWDGQSLTKNGDGTLVLSASNSYAGTTTANGGVLQAGIVDAFKDSRQVIINTGAILDLNDFNQTANRLSGAGDIALGAATLTANNNTAEDASSFDGRISGTGGLTKTGAGELALSGTTAWSGPTSIQGGTLTLDGRNGGARLVSDIYGQDNTALRLINGATLTGRIDPTDVTVGSGSSWTMTADSITGNLINAGSIVFAPPAAGSGFKTLTVEGRLDGAGTLSMNTDLAARRGDLVIANETAGQHNVVIANPGGDSSGPGQSLKLIAVSAPGLSNGTFALPSSQVDVGAYRYSLLRGEQLTDAGGSGDAGDWYLANLNDPDKRYPQRSQLTNDMLAAANTAKYATFASLNNLHKRLGELRLDQDGGAGNDLWMRAYEKRYTLHLDDSVDQKVDGFEAGYDHQFRFDGGRFSIGALAGGGQSRIYSMRDGSGTIDNNQIGAYATWILDNGIYVDLIGRHFWFRHDYRLEPLGSLLPETGSSSNTAWSLDVETGKRFDFKDGWYLEPQAELNWLRNSRAGFTSSLGNRITLESGQTVNGRLGLAGGKVLKSDSGRLTQLYGRLDWSKDLNSDGRVAINGNSFDAVKDDGSWIAAIGVQTAGGEQNRLQFYTEVEAGLGSPAVKQDWGVNVGLRWSF